MERLKPNGISHTAYPEKPCTDFHEWTAYITRSEMKQELTEFEEWCDDLVKDFERTMKMELATFKYKLDEHITNLRNEIEP
jgi:hypothetical protein